MKLFVRFIRDTRGSLSLLIMSLFMASVLTLAILTNISSIYLAKRALTQATEAAAQRGVRNLDFAAYYSGEFNLSRAALTLMGSGEKDPGIPIDCAKGKVDAAVALADWVALGKEERFLHSRENLQKISIEEIACDGYHVTVSTNAEVPLPFPMPFIGINSVTISSNVTSVAERKITSNYYGLTIE